MAEQPDLFHFGQGSTPKDMVLTQALSVIAEDDRGAARLLAEMISERRRSRSIRALMRSDAAVCLGVSLLCISAMLVLIETPSVGSGVLRWAEYVLAVPILFAGTWFAFGPIFRPND